MNNIKEIKNVTFVLENCEYVTIPVENFLELDLTEVDNECYNLECIIENMDNIEYHPFTNDWNPFTRLAGFNDIVSLDIDFTDGTSKVCNLCWKGTDTNNYCQISHKSSWNKISIIVNEENAIKKQRARCSDKADKILDILYQDFAIDSCSDCCYKADCENLRKNNNDITICDVLYLMQK